MNKKFIFLFIILSTLILLPFISSAKADQYYSGNSTCEGFVDAQAWSAVSTKNIGIVTEYYNWSRDSACPGEKECDITQLYTSARYLQTGTTDDTVLGQAYAQIANYTESQTDPSTATYSRYMAYQNETMAAGTSLGPRDECGTGGAETTCDVSGQGYENASQTYSIKVYAYALTGAGKYVYITDIFNIQYDYCWTPIIYDAYSDVETNSYDQTFYFDINVTNPGTITNVTLWTRDVGGSWSQEGSQQQCDDCAQEKLTFSATFTAGDIGNKEYKFVSVDNDGYSVEAGSAISLGTSTNECTDIGNDCIFSVTDVVVAEGTPNIDNETVNAVQSGAVDGWGSNWTFSTNVSNPVDGAGDVNLTLLLDTGSGFVEYGSAQCSDPCSTSEKFTFYIDNLTSSDISSAQYRFNATNLNGSTIVSQDFTIEKDDTEIIYIVGDNTIANRSDSQTQIFTVQINDTDKNELINATDVSFEITYNGITYGAVATNQSNETGHATYYFDPPCTPTKYEVGDQDWRASIPTNSFYKSVTLATKNVSIRGDISLVLNDPSGLINYTQEGIISFLGSTTDDCSDSLETTTFYYANSSTEDITCDSSTLIGANAFKCDYQTAIATDAGYYNVTMLSNYTNHYDNETTSTGDPGLFYLEPLRRLTSINVTPESDFYYVSDWNFSVTASSGDTTPMKIHLELQKAGGASQDCNDLSSCENITVIDCVNCVDEQFTWLKNFTQADVGTWFYKAIMYNNITGLIEIQTDGTDSFQILDITPESITFSDITQTPSSAQWGGTEVIYNVTVDTSITDNNLTVYLWNSLSETGPWNLVGTEIWNNETAGQQILNFTRLTDSTDIGTNYYFFNATDGAGTTNNSAIGNYLITKDYINLDYLVGAGDDSNRRGSQSTLLSFKATNGNGTIMTNFPIKYSITTNNVTYYTDGTFIQLTNTTGYANFNFDASCTDDYTNAPKFLVGEQQWKVELNDSLTDIYFQNDSSLYSNTNIFVNGDITLDFTNPSGALNYTQEDTISFLGATVDDCDDALTSTVIYNANTTGDGLICDTVTQVGANAFTCDYATSTSTTTGWYNTTMFANFTYHYDNFTQKNLTNGLFYLNPLRRLSANNVTPDSELYSYDNWLFEVNATSGDSQVMRIELYLQKAGSAAEECSLTSECENITLDICTNCQNEKYEWYKNFTQADVGTWFYQIKMVNNATDFVEAQTTGTDSFQVQDIATEEILFKDITQTPSSAQWGGTEVIYNVTVSTTSTNNITVYLWNSLSASGPWNLIGTETHSNSTGGDQTLNFTRLTDGTDIGTNYFFFNATDSDISTNSSDTNTYIITKDYIDLDYFAGDGLDSNRRSDQFTTLSFQATNANGTIMGDFPLKYSVTYNNVTYYTDDTFIINTNTTGYSNFDFNATCSGEYAGAPKFLVDEQQWKVELNDSLLDYYFQNDSSNYVDRNIFVYGDISLDFTSPDGLSNYTQEDTINFLGATVDDCGDALESTVVYHGNTTGDGIICDTTTLVGANAFTCNYVTDINTKEGWYNTTMYSNFTYHYDNFTQKNLTNGLFYLNSIKRLANPQGNASTGLITDGWGSPNWNFSVVASSGDINNVYKLALHLGPGINPAECSDSLCIAQTSVVCDNCVDETRYWYRNFTSSNQGDWFYQFKMNDTGETSTSGTTNFVTVTEDETNITYGGKGNNTIVILNSTNQTLSAQVYDLDKMSYNVTVPSARVSFKLLDAGYTGGEYFLGYGYTNETGHAEFNLSVGECAPWIEGDNIWIAEIEDSEDNYSASQTDNFTVEIQMPGCQATILIEDKLVPEEVFENLNFTFNTTINSAGGASNNVFVTLTNKTEGWIIYNPIQNIGTVNDGQSINVTWIVTPLTYESQYLNVTVNSSNAGADSENSENFTSYREFPSTATLTSLPSTIESGNELILEWDCETQAYRIGEIMANVNSSGTTIKASSNTGTEWVEVAHSAWINTSGTIQMLERSFTGDQFNSNGNDKCLFKIENIGDANVSIEEANLTAYYLSSARVEDIIMRVDSFETTGMETSEGLLNISVKMHNGLSIDELVNLTVNITNSTGYVVNTSEILNINILAGDHYYENITNIDTSSWFQDDYVITAEVSDGINNLRTEDFIFKDVTIQGTIEDYMCNQTTEEYSVIVYHPFEDSIDYNVSLNVPTGWSYSGDQWINATTPGNYSVIFNLTSNSTDSTTIINSKIEYTYPGISKEKTDGEQIENGIGVPILEVIRETPREVSNSTEFISRLIIYNKGCADATNIEFVEENSVGWTIYSQTLDGVSAGQTDIPNKKISFDSTDFGTIKEGDYKVIEYKTLSNLALDFEGTLRYNLTWDGRNIYEAEEFDLTTSKYSEESHLVFDIRAVDSYLERSAQPNENQTYNFSIKNRGDLQIESGNWEVNLSIAQECSASNLSDGGTYSSGILNWAVPQLSSGSEKIFNFTMNCTTSGDKVFTAIAWNDTREVTSVEDISPGLGCSGEDCYISQNYTFLQPAGGLRYSLFSQVEFDMFYNFTGNGLTIGEGVFHIHDVDGNEYNIWQDYSFVEESGTREVNFTFTEAESIFLTREPYLYESMTIGNTSSQNNGNANITVEGITTTWNHGRLFEDEQNLFINIKSFVFNPTAPILKTPENDSLAFSLPVVLSWEDQTTPGGVTLNYYVYGDNVDGSTLLGTTTDLFYLWSGMEPDVYYWKVLAESSEGVNSSFSETWQYELDTCLPDADYAYALTYPMSYNNITDTITVWGSDGSGIYDAMGESSSNPITMTEIYEFGKAVRGICAVTNPAPGAYAVLTRLELGNITDSLNTTFVKTSGEAIDFGKQVQLNFNATLIAGELSPELNPYAGSTLSFSGLDATDHNEGQLYVQAGATIEVYDSFIIHKVSKNDSNPFKFNVFGNMIAKRSSVENIWSFRLLNGSDLDLNDVVFTDMGIGLYPEDSSTGFEKISVRYINDSGLYLNGNIDISVTIIEISESTNAIKIEDYNGTTNLINSVLNWSNLNFTGNGNGTLNQQFTYDPKVTDSVGAALENVSLFLYDVRGDEVFSISTDTSGEVLQQLLTTALYSYTEQNGLENGPYTLKIKKFEKAFVTAAKEFSAATVETLQLEDNLFVTHNSTIVENLSGIYYTAPTIVSYGDEINSSWGFTGTLANPKIVQSEFFEIFANGTKLIKGTEYSINYETGALTFTVDQTGYDVYPVYSYGGDITIATGTETAQCIDMSELYAYMQYNLSEVIDTVDGAVYTSYVDLIIGNSTTGGCIYDSDTELQFADGFTYSFGSGGGYIDLLGVSDSAAATGGTTGGTGGLPITVYSDVGSRYEPGEEVRLVSTAVNSTGYLISSTVNVETYYPNGTLLNSGTSSQTSLGRFEYTFNAPSVGGTYSLEVDITSGSDQIHDTKVFIVTTTYQDMDNKLDQILALLNSMPSNVWDFTGGKYTNGVEA